jgi:hypothetical protein
MIRDLIQLDLLEISTGFVMSLGMSKLASYYLNANWKYIVAPLGTRLQYRNKIQCNLVDVAVAYRSIHILALIRHSIEN